MGHIAFVGVGVLGRVVTVAPGGQTHPLGDGLSARLLSVLAASANRPVPVEALADGIWSGHPPKSARNAIQVQVHHLRQALSVLGDGVGGGLGPSIRTDRHAYSLDVAVQALDVLYFESLVDSARQSAERGDYDTAVELAGRALALHRGEPFGGFADEIGLDAQAGRLVERRLDVEDLVAEARLNNGGDLDIGGLRALVDAAPFRERRWGYLMLALFRSGRQVDALRTYGEAAQMLGEHLGIEPGAELRHLEERILLQDPALRSERTHPPDVDLPAFPTRFVGRDTERDEIAKQVVLDRVVTLVGLGGAGKTRLAVEVAESLTSSFETITFVGLADIGAGAHIEQSLRSRLAPSGPSDGAAIGAVIRAVRYRELLLVLDNAESDRNALRHIVDELTQGCPRVHVLMTSRRPVGARGEIVRRISSLTDEDASELFVAAAHRVAPNLALGDHAEVIAGICEAVGRIPLLVELAASQLKMTSLDRLADAVRHRLELGTGEDDLTGAVLSWGLDQLTEEVRQAAAALTVFRGGWREDDADVVLAAVGVDGRVAAQLVDRSLIAFDPLTGRGSMLPPVRELIGARSPAVAASAAEAHAHHFAALAERELASLTTFDHTVSLELLDREQHNIRAALEWGIARRDPTTLTAMPTFGVYLWRRSRPQEGRRWFDALEAEFDPLVEFDPLSALYSAHLAMWASQPDIAADRLDRAEAHIRSLDSPRLLGRLLHARGNVEGWGRGRAATSLDWFRAAHETLAADQDPFAVVSTVCEGYMAVRSGRPERADEVVGILSSGDVRAVTGSLGVDMVRGLAALYSGDTGLADHLVVAACDKLDQLGVSILKGPGLVPLVWISVLRDRLDEGRERAADGYRFAFEQGGGWRLGDAATANGMVEAARGNHPTARSWFERGLRSGMKAPENDVVALAAAGLIEVGDWLDDRRREAAAVEVRHLLDDHEIALPAGFERVFPRVSSTCTPTGATGRSSVPRLVNALREVLDGT